VGHIASTAEVRNTYKILVGKPEVKKPLRRPNYRWVDYTEIDVQKTG
jgi:hypothetical protein